MQTAKVIRVQFAEEASLHIEVRQQPLIAWVSRRTTVPQSAPRPALSLGLVFLMVCLAGALVKPARAAIAGTSTDLAVLVMTARANDAALPAIPQALDFLGKPYTVHLASAQPAALTAVELSPTMNVLANTLQQRMNYNASGVVATRNADSTVTLTVTKAARIPVTGLVNGGVVSFTGTAPVITAENCAGQRITCITLAAGQTVTVKKL